MIHGQKKVETHRFENGTYAFKSLFWCAKHGFLVDAEQWRSEHQNCRETGKDLIGGAARSLPVTRRFSRLKVFKKAA